MYTTDEDAQKHQYWDVQQVINQCEQTFSSSGRRIEELTWWRAVYQSFGNWQTAIDRLETQMIVWGRDVQPHNTVLYEQYHAELQALVVPAEKAVWDESDHQRCGRAQAFSEARYAMRFLPVEEALTFLKSIRARARACRDDPQCLHTDRLKSCARAETLDTIISCRETFCPEQEPLQGVITHDTSTNDSHHSS